MLDILKKEAQYQGSICNHRMAGLLQWAVKQIEARHEVGCDGRHEASEECNNFMQGEMIGLRRLYCEDTGRLNLLREACKGVPETLRQSADLLEDEAEPAECRQVREMADRLEKVIA